MDLFSALVLASMVFTVLFVLLCGVTAVKAGRMKPSKTAGSEAAARVAGERRRYRR